MKDRIVLVTGSTEGIGKATALQLATLGAIEPPINFPGLTPLSYLKDGSPALLMTQDGRRQTSCVSKPL